MRRKLKYPAIVPDDVIVCSNGFHIEKITDKYDDSFPFSAFDEFLERLFGELVYWSNIDDLGFLVVSFSRVPNISEESLIKICEFINNLNQ